MSDDLFAGGDTPAVIDVKTDEVIGENGKYKDLDTAAKALVHKDQFIERLKQEAEEARQAAVQAQAELQKRMNEEDFLKKLESVARPSQVNQDQPVDRDVPPALKPEDVEAILEKREAEKTRAANLQAVTDKLTATFGQDWKQHVQRQANALQMSTVELTALAAKSPTVFYKLVGLEDGTVRQPDFTAPPRSSVATPPAQSGQKDFNYWREQRRQKGDSWYFRRDTQQAIWQEAQRLGDAFMPKE